MSYFRENAWSQQGQENLFFSVFSQISLSTSRRLGGFLTLTLRPVFFLAILQLFLNCSEASTAEWNRKSMAVRSLALSKLWREQPGVTNTRTRVESRCRSAALLCEAEKSGYDHKQMWGRVKGRRMEQGQIFSNGKC